MLPALAPNVSAPLEAPNWLSFVIASVPSLMVHGVTPIFSPVSVRVFAEPSFTNEPNPRY